MTSNLSPDQIARRLAGITATDIAAIVGVHPYRSAVDIWLEKMGKAPPFEGNERTKWGLLLEKPIRRDFEERHGVVVMTSDTLENPDRPWQLATPDGLVYPSGGVDPIGGLEIKCHTVYLSHLYGAPGSDEVPPYELCQCTQNMAVTGLPLWNLVAFIDGKTTDYVIDRDDELIGMLTERGERFLVDHVRTGIPPAPDGSDAYTAWIKRDLPKEKRADLVAIDGDPNAMLCVERLNELRNEIHEREREESAMVQALKLAIGDAAGISFPGRSGRLDAITWKRSKDEKPKVSYLDAFREVQASAALLASGKASEFKRAITVLDKLADQTFANTRATMTATEIRELLTGTLETLTAIAGDGIPAKHMKPGKVGSRRFVVPKWWKAKAAQSDE